MVTDREPVIVIHCRGNNGGGKGADNLLPYKGAIPFPGLLYGLLVEGSRRWPFKPVTRVQIPYSLPFAGLVEQADTTDSKSVAFSVWVQIPYPAPYTPLA